MFFNIGRFIPLQSWQTLSSLVLYSAKRRIKKERKKNLKSFTSSDTPPPFPPYPLPPPPLAQKLTEALIRIFIRLFQSRLLFIAFFIGGSTWPPRKADDFGSRARSVCLFVFLRYLFLYVRPHSFLHVFYFRYFSVFIFPCFSMIVFLHISPCLCF